MRKIIKASKQSNDYYINIDCYFEIPQYVTNATNVYTATGNEQEKFENMINEITKQLENSDCKIMDAHWSNRSSDSYYIAFYVRDINGILRSEALIHLRVSRHYTQNEDDEAYLKNGLKYYDELDKRYKINDIIPTPIFKNIIIGDKGFKNEQMAVKYIKEILQKLRNPSTDLEEIMRNFSLKRGYSNEGSNKSG